MSLEDIFVILRSVATKNLVLKNEILRPLRGLRTTAATVIANLLPKAGKNCLTLFCLYETIPIVTLVSNQRLFLTLS